MWPAQVFSGTRMVWIFFSAYFYPDVKGPHQPSQWKVLTPAEGWPKKNKIKNKQTKTNCWPPVFHLVFHGSSFWSQRSGVCILRQIHTHHVDLEGPCSIHSMHLNTHTIMNVFCHQAFCFVFLQFSLHIKHRECLCVDIMPLFVTYTSCSCSKTNSYFFFISGALWAIKWTTSDILRIKELNT